MKMVKVLTLAGTCQIVGSEPDETGRMKQHTFLLNGSQISQVGEQTFKEKLSKDGNVILLSESDAKSLLDMAHKRGVSPGDAYVLKKIENESESNPKDTKKKGGKKE